MPIVSTTIGPIKLVEPILRLADMINGDRCINGNKKDFPFYCQLGQEALDKAAQRTAADMASAACFGRINLPASERF